MAMGKVYLSRLQKHPVLAHRMLHHFYVKSFPPAFIINGRHAVGTPSCIPGMR